MLVIQDRMITYENEMNRAIKQLKSVTQMSDKVRINSDIHALKEKIQELKNTLTNYGEDQ